MDYRKQMDIITAYSCRISALYSEWAKRHGMSYNTMMVLFAMRQTGPCTQKQIVEEWMISKQTVNTVVKDLEKKGYVTISAGRNQKEKKIAFTTAGEHMMKTALEETMAMEDRIWAQIGEENCCRFVTSMQQFAESFEEELEHYGK